MHIGKIILLLILVTTLVFPTSLQAKTSTDPEPLPWSYEHIGLTEAWDKTTGSDEVTIAVIDNGFGQYHPDLKSNLWLNKDEIPDNNKDDDNNGYIDDIHGWSFVSSKATEDSIETQKNNKNHSPVPNTKNLRDVSKKTVNHGTIVAGLLGAQGSNDIAGRGVNWDVSLMNLRVIDNDGGGHLDPLPKAVNYAINNGADIITISIAGSIEQEEKKDKLSRALDKAYQADIPIFAAAGNKLKNLNKTPAYPVCYDQNDASNKEKLFGVSAVNKNHRIFRYSNIGKNCVDITAPGTKIPSTLRYSPEDNLYGGKWSGTSFATPLVSGVAGLIKSLHPDWGPEKIYNTLATTTLHSSNKEKDLYKNFFGSGMLQADQALEYAFNQIPPQTKSITGLATISPTRQDKEIKSFSSTTAYLPYIEYSSSYIEPVFGLSGYNYLVVSPRKNKTRLSFVGKYFDLDWTLPYQDINTIASGQINADNKVETLVTRDNNPGRIKLYSGTGDIIATTSLEASIISTEVVNKLHNNTIALLARQNDKYYLYWLSSDLKTRNKIELSMLLNTPQSMTSGDIDGDKKQELILALQNKSNNSNLLSYLEQDGTLISEFYSYNPGANHNIKLIAGDTNDNGKDEVVTIPKNKSKVEAKIWNQKIEVINSWQINKLKHKNIFPILETNNL